MKENISWGELIDCQDYAERVVEYYKLKNNGELPLFASDAEETVREYNKKHSFKSIYGYSIGEYIEDIVFQIGLMVECEEED